jgi:hypothetical protein
MYSEKVRAAVEANAAGEDVAWDLGIAGSTEGMFLALLLQVPSPILGQSAIQANIVFGKGMSTTDQEIDQIVTNSLEQLRLARTQMLAQPPSGPEPLLRG